MNRISASIAMAANGGFVLADQALISATNFLVTVLLVRSLGLDGLGTYTLLAMLVVFLQSLEQACIGTPLLTLGPKQSVGESPHYWAAVLRLHGQFLLVASALGGVLALSFDRFAGLSITERDLVIALIAALGRCSQDFFRQSGFARGRARSVFGMDALACGLQLGSLAVLWATRELSPARALIALGASSAFASLVGLFAYGCYRCSAEAVRRVRALHGRMGGWLVALALMQWFTSNAFAVAAGVVLGPAAVGALKAGQTVLGLQHVFLLAADNIVSVRAASLAANGLRAELKAYFRRVLGFGGAVTLAISSTTAIFPEFFARLMCGRIEADTVLAIRVFALHYAIVFAISMLSIRLRTEERTRPIFLASALGATFSILAATPTASVFGLPGALAGMILQQTLILLSLLLALRVLARRATDSQAVRAIRGESEPAR